MLGGNRASVREEENTMNEPLAQRLRPKTLADVCGQQHLLAPGRVFRRTIESGRIPNMIFYGPSGTGKTTVARIIAENSGMTLHKLNGTSCGTGDIKAVLKDIGTLAGAGGILLYLDEIQYLNKKQQQSLLECIEDGSVTLIASTTENPYFYIYNALLSRCTVFEFKSLSAADVERGVHNALKKLSEGESTKVCMDEDACAYLAESAGGDLRKALGCLDFAVTAAPIEDGEKHITLEMIQQVTRRTAMRYDREGDDHYDIVSAYQKSMRGSDPTRRCIISHGFGSGRSRLCMPPLDGVRLRRRGPCVATDHPHRESGRRCRHDGRSAGSAHPACGCRHFNGDGAEIEQR